MNIWRILVVVGMLTLSPSSQAVQLDWLKTTLFFAYTPSRFHFRHDRPAPAGRESIAQDLKLLRRYSDGLILYATDASTEHVLAVAHELKFRAVVVGVWAINDSEEINRVVELARRYPKLVRAVAIGNEGVFWRRYTKKELAMAMQKVRTALPDIAVTTTEPFAAYLGTPASMDCNQQDFLLPTIHPVFESWFKPAATRQSVQFVNNVVTRLVELCRKPVLIKETGIPSGPVNKSYSEQLQRQFWQELLSGVQKRESVSVALFEAFDAPWKIAEIKKQSGVSDERERYWGWFTQAREPKAVVDLLPVRH